MSDYGIYDKHIKKIIALNKKRGTYFPVQNPKPEKPLNPMSDFLKDKAGNPVPEGEARITKGVIFSVDEQNGVKAVAENRSAITLGKSGAKLEQVDRINGVWHIQNKFPHEITIVRKRDMVLLKKLDREEHTGFEFYTAKHVGYNCFGPFVSKGNGYDYIVAKCNTDRGPFWGYGKTMDDARAYLCLKLYDECQDAILGMLCSKIRKNQK